MAGGGGSQKQTTQTTNEPWKVAQPALTTGLNAAQDLYKSGVGGQQYQGSTVVPYSWQSMAGRDNMMNAATNASSAFLQNFNDQWGNNLNGGLNDLQRDSVAQLQGQANGSMLNGNPFVDQLINRSAQDINDAVGLSAAGVGRYGSGIHQGAVADAVGDMSSNMRFNNYNTERGYQQDAIGSLYNAGQQQQDNIRSNTGALQNAYGAWMSPFQTMMDVGGMDEDLATRTMNADIAKFNQGQSLPWDQIGRLQAIASGAGQMGRTETGYAQQPGRLQSAIGGGMAGYGMTSSPWGALLGAGLGAFG